MRLRGSKSEVWSVPRVVANVTRRRDGTSYTRLAGRQTIPVFILVPQVRLPKRLDLDRAARLWEGRLPELILANWSPIS